MKAIHCIKYSIVLSILILLKINGNANYIAYYKLINTAEEKFVLYKDKSCYIAYDEAFKQKKPFLKDPFIASQIALYLHDTVKCLSYLHIAFENGMPLKAVHVSTLFNKSSRTFQDQVDDTYTRYYRPPNIDSTNNELFCLLCYQSDSIKTRLGGRSEVFFENENQTRKLILDSFLRKGIFLNEMLLGITTDKQLADFHTKNKRPYLYDESPFGNAPSYEEYELRRKCPYNIVLHSRCFFRENEPLFFKAMLAGYLHPKEYGILEETSILWHKNDLNPSETCSTANAKICYNIFGKNPFNTPSIFGESETEQNEVEKNRAAIYLQKYSIDIKKKQMEKEVGIKFFFDFVDR